MEKEWIKYNPESRDTKYDTKMRLRNMIKHQDFFSFPVPIEMVQMSYTKEDKYNVEIGGEIISLKASEKDQEEGEPGIFFLAEPKKKTKIEEILMEIFK
ncbi:hypothetical protein KAJ87_02315 [Candidatus Pacearchaeota archaeon]|nr:hypothetical protein [Candidatus Pacearchaeota archaeon]